MASLETMLLSGKGIMERELGHQDFGNWIWVGIQKLYEMQLQSKEGAIACILLSLFFSGTWPAVISLLERRGRLPQHTFLDYALTNLLAAVIIDLTIGQIGDASSGMPTFSHQLSQIHENWPSVLIALAGGVALSIGNLSAQYAWALVSLSVVEVVSSSICVTIGTTTNYFLDGKRNEAEILFPGVGCFLIAVFLGSAVHKSYAADNKQKLKTLPAMIEEGTGNKSIFVCKETSVNKDIEKAHETNSKPELGSADFLIQLEEKRSIKVLGRSTWLGLAATFLAGCCFALFSPLFNIATNDQFHLLKKGVPHLNVYTGFFYFSVSFFVVAAILNVIFLYHPILGLPKSSIRAYVRDWDGRGWAYLAGLLCGFGNGLRFMGGEAAGFATADSVQALPLVTTLWGVLVFGEYRRSSRRTCVLLVSMVSMFITAVGFFLASSPRRKL